MRNLRFCIFITFWVLCAAEDKRAPSGFTALRGKKLDNNEVSDEYADKRPPFLFPELAVQRPIDDWTPADALGFYKRVPSGFFGLRGKKDLDFPLDNGKRVPSGFVGMRGKKLLDDFDDGFEEKRPTSFAFGYYDPKRAPESRFFGMRGKRQPNKNSFFGMRGKKYDLRGKFVGVRGKKSAETSNSEYFEDDTARYNDVSLEQLMYLLAQNEGN